MDTRHFIPYSLLYTLSPGHSSGITSVSFSSCGRYLASGGEDKALIIWDMATGKKLHHTEVDSPVLCTLWHPSNSSLFYGCQNGRLVILEGFADLRRDKSAEREVLIGVNASVYALDVDATSDHLAVGVGSEVQVVKKVTRRTYATSSIMPAPPGVEPLPHNTDLDHRIRPRAVHLIADGEQLIVSYLNHGIVCWDVTTRTLLWSMKTKHEQMPCQIGTSSLSPDHRSLLVFNLRNGLDLYNLGENNPIQSYRSSEGQENYNISTGVAFLHNGTAVVCGSHLGSVTVWNTATGIPLQTLQHKDVAIQAICARQLSDCVLIATATMATARENYIQIWRSATDTSLQAWTGSKDMVLRHKVLLVTLSLGIIFLFLFLFLGSTFMPYVALLRDVVLAGMLLFLEFVGNCSNNVGSFLRRVVGQIGFFSKQVIRRALLELLREDVSNQNLE